MIIAIILITIGHSSSKKSQQLKASIKPLLFIIPWHADHYYHSHNFEQKRFSWDVLSNLCFTKTIVNCHKNSKKMAFNSLKAD